MRRILILLPLLALFIPLPFAEAPGMPLRLAFAALAWVWIASAIATMRLLQNREPLPWVEWLLVAAPAIVLGALSMFQSAAALPFAMILLFAHAFAWGVYRAFEGRFVAPALSSLALAVSTFLAIEWPLNCLPAARLRREIAATPSLYSPRLERANRIYSSHGFRGRRPAPSPADGIRIFSMGGSSTYGEPLVSPHVAYPAVLDELLRERRPTEKFEVYNAGLAGMGTMQIVDAVETEIVPRHPHIVTVNAWYNDSSRQSIWYGTQGQSDRDTYVRLRVLRFVEHLPVFRSLYHTRSFAWFRSVLLSFASEIRPQPASATTTTASVSKRRMSPEEYRWALEKIAKLGEKYDFLPVFVFEPLNRTRSYEDSLQENEYYRELADVAKRFNVPVVDSLSAFHEHAGNWLFYDIVHLNERGHRLMAETVYSALFDSTKADSRTKEFLAKHGFDWTLPTVQRVVSAPFERSTAAGHLLRFEARLPFGESDARELLLTVHGESFPPLAGLGSEWRRFEIVLPSADSLPPFFQIDISSVPTDRRSNRADGIEVRDLKVVELPLERRG